MKDLVSKVRTKKTRTREKNVGKETSRKMPFLKRPIVGVFLAVLLWTVTLATLGMGQIFKHGFSMTTLLPLCGQGVLLLVCLFATGIFLQITRPAVLKNNAILLLLSLISLISVIAGEALLYATDKIGVLPPEILQFILPMALAPILATILVDSVVGIGIGTWTSLALVMLTRYDQCSAGASSISSALPLFLAGLTVTVVAAQGSMHVKKRSKIFRIAAATALAQATCVLAITLLDWQSASTVLVLHQLTICIVSSFFSAIVVLIIMPLFQATFHITTDIELFELSDLGHPLLQRLAIEAPGTYHHSLIVANLAQAAADEIGANSLLARVCAYFHDIGKLTKPNFFTENIQLQSNPHDDLAPSMSTLVITSHVKEGLSLALLHKLPTPVTRVIQEHHGTSLLQYFHHKAREQLEFELEHKQKSQANGNAKLDESSFRYPGPKPSSKESAIICLADAIEAASRSMEKPTPTNIEGLIYDITNTRLKDGQLDSCDLSLMELARIKRSFIFTLTNMLHARIPYPKDEDRDKQQTKTSQGEQTGNRQTDSTSDAPAGQTKQR